MGSGMGIGYMVIMGSFLLSWVAFSALTKFYDLHTGRMAFGYDEQHGMTSVDR